MAYKTTTLLEYETEERYLETVRQIDPEHYNKLIFQEDLNKRLEEEWRKGLKYYSLGELIETFKEGGHTIIKKFLRDSIDNAGKELSAISMKKRELQSIPNLHPHWVIIFEKDWAAQIEKLKDEQKKYGWFLQQLIHPKSTKDKITEADFRIAKEVPIEQFYQGKLRKTGRYQYGRCPFHNEKHGSFYIFPNNRYKCFGCDVHGDVIDFVANLQSIKILDAIKLLLHK